MTRGNLYWSSFNQQRLSELAKSFELGKSELGFLLLQLGGFLDFLLLELQIGQQLLLARVQVRLQCEKAGANLFLGGLGILFQGRQRSGKRGDSCLGLLFPQGHRSQRIHDIILQPVSFLAQRVEGVRRMNFCDTLGTL